MKPVNERMKQGDGISQLPCTENDMKYTEVKERLYDLLAIEYNCSSDVFSQNENIITESALIEGRRKYSEEKYFFHMVTTGNGAVITADSCLHPFLCEYTKDKCGHWLFELPNLMRLERELNRYSYSLTQTHHMFLPCKSSTVRSEHPVRWYYGEQIHSFYGDGRFPNAICEKYLPHRPDRIAVVAYDGDTVMGMAGGSEDAAGWIQIGIDVMPAYRSKGVGTYLVSVLKNKIEDMGYIPFYGTSVSNYHSWNIALNCGFKPAWVEVGAERV